MKTLLAILFGFLLIYGCAQQGGTSGTGTSGCESASGCQLRVFTEEFPPYNYLDSSGHVAGSSTEAVRGIMERLNQTSEIEYVNFSYGYALLQSGPNIAMYSVGRTPEREGMFKWAGPIGEWKMTFYAKEPANGIALRFMQARDDAQRMEIAKSAGKICVVRDDVRHQLLVADGFTDLELVDHDGECAPKLAAGEVALWFGSSTSFGELVQGQNLSTDMFRPVFQAGTNELYIAFSKDVPDSTVSAWQAALDEMKADGTFTASRVQGPTEEDFRAFVAYYEAKAEPLERQLIIQSFTADTSGNEGDYDKLTEYDLAYTKIYTNRTDFARLSEFMESGNIQDPILKRELVNLYYSYLSGQVDEEKLEAIINLQNEVDMDFYTYRVDMNGTNLTDNEVDEILKTSTDSGELEAVWLGSKAVGPVVSNRTIQLVKMRNEIARELGFSDYYEMQLILSEEDPEMVDALFDQLDEETSAEYAQLKEEIGSSLSQRYGVSEEGLMPWHYEDRFFQQAPASVYSVDFDGYYSGQDVVNLTEEYYAGIGLPIYDVINRSDLYERPGKYQHAYTTWVDREGDIRIVANVVPNAYWMDTMLHESGHAAHMKNVDQSLPWTLKCVYIPNTEAVALMFQSMAYNPYWIQHSVGISDQERGAITENSTRYLRADALVFSRWSQVMYRFERAMYQDPDQDLNKLWWDLVEEYQLVQKPEGRDEPDWASKIHIIDAPAYYHNYQLGYLIAAQLRHSIREDVLNGSADESYYGREDVGDYLKDNYLAYGCDYTWDEVVEKATGENLTAEYFAQEVGSG